MGIRLCPNCKSKLENNRVERMEGYKFLTSEDKSGNGEPIKWKKGVWKKVNAKELSLCNYGLHACKTPLQSLSYVYGDNWWVVEAKGKIIHSKNDKFVVEQMRIVKRLPVKKILVRFAIECAKRCLHKFEKRYPNDKRPRQAIKATEAYVKNPCKKTEAAAEAAARAAVTPTAAATWAAGAAAEVAAEAAAGAAVGAAAWAAEAAARAAARAAEIKWQEKTLIKLVKKYGG